MESKVHEEKENDFRYNVDDSPSKILNDMSEE